MNLQDCLAKKDVTILGIEDEVANDNVRGNIIDLINTALFFYLKHVGGKKPTMNKQFSDEQVTKQFIITMVYCL